MIYIYLTFLIIVKSSSFLSFFGVCFTIWIKYDSNFNSLYTNFSGYLTFLDFFDKNQLHYMYPKKANNYNKTGYSKSQGMVMKFDGMKHLHHLSSDWGFDAGDAWWLGV